MIGTEAQDQWTAALLHVDTVDLPADQGVLSHPLSDRDAVGRFNDRLALQIDPLERHRQTQLRNSEERRRMVLCCG